ncbi:hypothetical protein D8674_030854 [Pyrus ussuriensis x Pyrus communis]|uniref:Uncharacterized protein n=1 Tax=Pyrus ussuriensis x Pyrus communis TaxID=2448454 RepID=A0A5N5FA35_9ROSA|nr:hypothetical protein D8674_030854 [Pyrus ussuriensis x Pyrus communis]
MANTGRDHTAVTVTTTEYNRTTSLKLRIEGTKWLLHPLAGKSSCCVFKGKYRPHIISISPYHYGDKHVVMMQQHKWRFLDNLLGRTHVEGKHLLDLLRLSFVPEPQDDSPQENVEFIQSAKKLHDLAGIKFKTGEAQSFLDIRFCSGVLEIPRIKLDDLHTHFFLNFVAFEQCYSHCPKYITTYAAFMTCLVRTPMDATFLSDKNIIENYLGTDKEVVHFFKNLGKDVPFDIDKNILHVQWARFRFKYFESPWSFLSALAALIQAFFAVYGYLRPPSSG